MSLKIKTYAGAEGSLHWLFNCKTHVLVISGNGCLPDYDLSMSFLPGWTRLRNLVHEVRFSEGVRSIGDYAFFGLENNTTQHSSCLHRILFPKTLERIGSHAFRLNEELERIDLSDLPNLHSIGQMAFASCSRAKSADLSRCGVLSSIDAGVFDDCSSLQYIDLSGCFALESEAIIALARKAGCGLSVLDPNGDRVLVDSSSRRCF